MTVTPKDVGKRLRLRDRRGEVVLRALSADGKTAYVDTMPEASLGYNFKGRFEDVPVEEILCRVNASTKGRKQAA
jgi:hypothetical protein